MRRARVLSAQTQSLPGWAQHRVERIDRSLLLETRSLKGKTLFITGASRGIGLAIALRAAKDGANIVVAAKSDTENPKIPGTIFSAAAEIEKAGGKALPIKVDVRDEGSVKQAVELAVKTFGGIDILINNASAISLTATGDTDMKRYDLMHSINTRGTFLCTKTCLPFLRKATNPHVLNLSPPLNMEPRWFGPHVAYTMAKYGMSMCVLGHAEELKGDGIAVNALWPRTTIATAAVNNLLGGETLMNMSRKPEIMADAAHCVLTRKSRSNTGNFYIDDEVLASEGLANDGLVRYKANPDAKYLAPDFFV
ncbi:short chain dehydrogenase, putative [Bodo saltans]|uniref:Hydroxysteroid dehydrogenase-like protein 2 n=1 Tax=Bodo saltans TaxID=75058 RepID=A0A0S4KLS4_BODSA|nr:short chain dehydrogenase, putative [Bodo saltans]|eukprot:CUI15324.1 short chain dehydrogenase, putative [Bodo saltans]